jgi:hypothetical protein
MCYEKKTLLKRAFPQGRQDSNLQPPVLEVRGVSQPRSVEPFPARWNRLGSAQVGSDGQKFGQKCACYALF